MSSGATHACALVIIAFLVGDIVLSEIVEDTSIQVWDNTAEGDKEISEEKLQIAAAQYRRTALSLGLFCFLFFGANLVCCGFSARKIISDRKAITQRNVAIQKAKRFKAREHSFSQNEPRGILSNPRRQTDNVARSPLQETTNISSLHFNQPNIVKPHTFQIELDQHHLTSNVQAANPTSSLSEAKPAVKPSLTTAGGAKRCSPEELSALLDGIEQRYSFVLPDSKLSPVNNMVEVKEPKLVPGIKERTSPNTQKMYRTSFDTYDDASIYDKDYSESLPSNISLLPSLQFTYPGYPGLSRISHLASIDSDTDSTSRIRDPMPLNTVKSRPKSRQASNSSYENEPK